jgi:hypothetical protein
MATESDDADDADDADDDDDDDDDDDGDDDDDFMRAHVLLRNYSAHSIHWSRGGGPSSHGFHRALG